MNISVLILTYNEEMNLPICLDSLSSFEDIVILDSFSSDKTADIALNYRARIVKRVFDNYASQRNFGLSEIKYRNEWVLMVDADEIVSPDLVEEISANVSVETSNVSTYRIRRKDFLLGKWIRHSSGYPTWFGRLIRVGNVRVERPINEEYITDGEVGYLKAHLHHYPFNKGFSAWLEKHNRYSTMEADLLIEGGLAEFRWRDFLSKDPATRRKAQKALFYRLPGRPLIMFLSLYFVRGGFLDGRSGLIFCLLRSFYEFMISCKVREKKRRLAGMPL